MMMAVTGNPAGYRLYADLASWWPLISAPQEYTEEAAAAATILSSAAIDVHDVLELGSGGGHNACHLKKHFGLTLVDLSEDMLAVSRRLNPECAHLRGDMRTIRLGRTFDAVFVHDAVDYMTTEADLRQVIETAFAHCRPGGVALFVPDHTAETFEPVTDHGGSDGPEGRGARYLEWTWDPDPGDTWIRSEYAFLLREADGSVRVVHETHRTGLFSRAVWLGLLAGAGFHAEAVTERTSEDRTPRVWFTGHRLAEPTRRGPDGAGHEGHGPGGRDHEGHGPEGRGREGRGRAGRGHADRARRGRRPLS
jgi:SAM-dependent methyltransferase